MIRHIQGALNVFANASKKIYAFYIVDEEISKSYQAQLSIKAFEKHLNSETIAVSPAESERILNAYYGFITWQQLETVLGIKFKTTDDVDKEIAQSTTDA